MQCAWAAARSKNRYLQAQFLRLESRRGPKKAVSAGAASLLAAASSILRDEVDYRDRGADYFTRRDKARVAQRRAARIRDLGYEVHLREAA